jgi:hypothetical protein
MKLSAGLVLVTTLITSGLVHGHYAGRFAAQAGTSPGPGPLHQISDVAGWSADEFLPVATRELAFQTTAEHRVFRHESGRGVVLSLTLGRPAVVAVHTPDVCYVAGGYQAMTKTQRVEVPTAQGPATLWVADYQKGSERLRIYWGWSAGNIWEAPDTPRWKFARAPQLAKLYVVHTLEADDDLTIHPETLIAAGPLLAAICQQLR